MVTTGVADLADNPISGDYSWTFTTSDALDTTPPTVTSTTPIDGETDVEIDASLSIIFSEAMDPATIDASTITLEDGDNNPISGTIDYSDTTATFTPDAIDSSGNAIVVWEESRDIWANRYVVGRVHSIRTKFVDAA